MGEIKSTMELVMERTRHLTLTDEEKREHALSEFKSSLNGLLQKFQDRSIRIDQFEKELHHLQETSELSSKEILLDEIAKRLDLDKDDHAMLDLLGAICEVETAGLVSVLGRYDEAMRTKEKVRTEQMREDLMSRGISGSSVLPNLEIDEKWGDERRRLRGTFNRLLVEEIALLRAGWLGRGKEL